jgi:methylated-DNA-[protein]-cysteine S-methyltransferase
MKTPSRSPSGYTLFDTTLGTCAIAWIGHEIYGVQLPEKSAALTLTRLFQKTNRGPVPKVPGWVRTILRRIVLHFQGIAQDFSNVPLFLDQSTPFVRRVYKEARRIRSGKTMTYGELAKRCGHPNAARAVGTALSKNPFPILVPCHRVVGANGNLGGFSASGGLSLKLKMLSIEGIEYAHGISLALFVEKEANSMSVLNLR